MNVTMTFFKGKIPIDIAFAFSWAVVSVFCVLLLPDGNVFRMIIGFPFVLVIPGYLLVSLIWPGLGKEEKRTPTFAERVILGLGMSIVIVSLLGIILDAVSLHITVESMVLSIFVSVIILGVCVIYSRNRFPPESRFTVDLDRCPLKSNKDSTFFGIIALGISLIVITAALFALTPSRQNYTNFSLLDQSGSITNLTENINVSEYANFIVVIECHEDVPVEYTLNVSLTDSVGNYVKTLEWGNHTFESDGMLELPLNFSSNVPGTYRLILLLTNNSTGHMQNLEWTIKVG